MRKIKAWGWVGIWVLISFSVAAPFSTLFILGCAAAVAGKFYFDPPRALSGSSTKSLDK